MRTFDAWKAVNRSVKTGETGLLIFEPREYESPEGGGTRTGYNVVRRFDVSQTHGEPLAPVQRIPFDGDEYNDYGLLFSWPNGDPIEPHRLERWFKDWQMNHGIESRIDLYGLRKSGQMHKIRLTGNNYQLVAANGGHSPEVLVSNYDEALETEKRNLSRLLEVNFYEIDRKQDAQEDFSVEQLVERAKDNPDLMRQLAVLVQNMRQPTPSAP